MSFYVRVFSLAEDFPSLYAICDELVEAGFQFATAPGKGEPDFELVDWNSIVLQYAEDCEPVKLERNIKEKGDRLFAEEQQEFIAALEGLPYSRGQKKALEIVKSALQIYAFEVEEDITEAGWDFLECMLDYLCDATDGYVQVDEEGIYGKEGELLIELE